MSDFIKVNFEDGRTAILPKNEIRLHKSKNGVFYLNETINTLTLIANTLLHLNKHESFDDRPGLAYDRVYGSSRITHEEYDRLCKELGVEG